MKSKRSILIYTPLIILLTISSCKHFESYIKEHLPKVSYKKVYIDYIGLESINLRFLWDIYNPNAVALPIIKTDITLIVEGKKFIETSLNKPITLKPNSHTETITPIKIDNQSLINLIGNIFKKDKIKYKAVITFYLQIDVLGNQKGEYPITVEKEGEIEIPKLPSISIESVKFHGFSILIGEGSIELVLKIENKNSYPIKPPKIIYSFALNQKEIVASKVLPEGKIIKPKGYILAKGIFKLSLKDLGKELYSAIVGKELLKLDLVGIMKLGSIKVSDFRYEKKISF